MMVPQRRLGWFRNLLIGPTKGVLRKVSHESVLGLMLQRKTQNAVRWQVGSAGRNHHGRGRLPIYGSMPVRPPSPHFMTPSHHDPTCPRWLRKEQDAQPALGRGPKSLICILIGPLKALIPISLLVGDLTKPARGCTRHMVQKAKAGAGGESLIFY